MREWIGGLGNLRKESRSSKISFRIFELYDLDISDLASRKITHYFLITKSNQFYTVLSFGIWEIYTSLENQNFSPWRLSLCIRQVPKSDRGSDK